MSFGWNKVQQPQKRTSLDFCAFTVARCSSDVLQDCHTSDTTQHNNAVSLVTQQTQQRCLVCCATPRTICLTCCVQSVSDILWHHGRLLCPLCYNLLTLCATTHNSYNSVILCLVCCVHCATICSLCSLQVSKRKTLRIFAKFSPYRYVRLCTSPAHNITPLYLNIEHLFRRSGDYFERLFRVSSKH